MNGRTTVSLLCVGMLAMSRPAGGAEQKCVKWEKACARSETRCVEANDEGRCVKNEEICQEWRSVCASWASAPSPVPSGTPKAEVVKSASSGNLAGIEWVRIPGGSFQMGSKDGESDEKPVHTVRVRAFEMSRTEVTVAQYAACVSARVCEAPTRCDWGEPNWGKSGREQHPVNCVSWDMAGTFAKWAGGRLPTEAEWEYAARGGQSYAYAGSSNVDEVAWYDSNSGGGTHPVGRKKANGYGLHDMSGNVWEWVQDWYRGSYTGAPADGSAWEGGGSLRVPRGGSWRSEAGDVRVAFRFVNDPGYRYSDLGFRLSRSGS